MKKKCNLDELESCHKCKGITVCRYDSCTLCQCYGCINDEKIKIDTTSKTEK